MSEHDRSRDSFQDCCGLQAAAPPPLVLPLDGRVRVVLLDETGQADLLLMRPADQLIVLADGAGRIVAVCQPVAEYARLVNGPRLAKLPGGGYEISFPMPEPGQHWTVTGDAETATAAPASVAAPEPEPAAEAPAAQAPLLANNTVRGDCGGRGVEFTPTAANRARAAAPAGGFRRPGAPPPADRPDESEPVGRAKLTEAQEKFLAETWRKPGMTAQKAQEAFFSCYRRPIRAETVEALKGADA